MIITLEQRLIDFDNFSLHLVKHGVTHTPSKVSFARLDQLLLLEQHRARLSAQEILIWDYVLSFCNNKNRSAWVSQKTLASAFGLRHHNVCRTIRGLREKGWLRTTHGEHSSLDLFPVCPTLKIWSDE